MENAIWNDRKLIAAEISKKENAALEEMVREASRVHQLKCPDKDCPNPDLKYCHGDVRDAYFAHLNNCGCDYAQFDKFNNESIRHISRILYQQFQDKEFEIQTDVKISQHDYVHFIVATKNGQKIAVRLVSKTDIKTLGDLYNSAKDIHIPIKIIEVNERTDPVGEERAGLIKRFQMVRDSKSLMVVHPDGNRVVQFATKPIEYQETGDVSQITIENNEITFDGFFERLEKASQANQEKKERSQKGYLSTCAPAKNPIKRDYRSDNLSIKSLLKRKNEKCICEICGREAPRSEFAVYQGDRGKCNKCMK